MAPLGSSPDKVAVLPRLVFLLLAVVAALLMLWGRRGGFGVEETDELTLLSVEFFGSGNSKADDTQRTCRVIHIVGESAHIRGVLVGVPGGGNLPGPGPGGVW